MNDLQEFLQGRQLDCHWEEPFGTIERFEAQAVAVEDISCTVIGPSEESHVFTSLVACSSFMADRSGVKSILVSTLLSIIRTKVATVEMNGILPSIVQLINGSLPVEVEVSTVRAPCAEGHNFRSQNVMYRYFGTLSNIRVQYENATAMLDPHREVFAVDPGHPTSIEFIRMWGPLGLSANKHFILHFTYAAQVQASLPSLVPFDEFQMAANDQITSTSSSGGSLSSRSTPGPLSLRQSSDSEPHLHAPSPGSPSPSAHIPSHLSYQITSGTSIIQICIILQIDPKVCAAARFVSANGRCRQARKLVNLVRKHKAMTSLLASIGFSNGETTVTYSGGRELSCSDVLESFDWSMSTFDHKSRWFHKAEQAALSTWKGTAPDTTNVEDRVLYEFWRAVVFLWRAGGPVESGNLPDPSSRNAVERAADSLTQKMLEQNLSAISYCLEPESGGE